MPTETEIREAVVLQREILGVMLFAFDEGTIEDLWGIIDPERGDREAGERRISEAVDALQASGTIQRTAKGWQVRQDVLAMLKWGPKAIEVLVDLGRWDDPATSEGNWDRLNDIQEAAEPLARFAREAGDTEAILLQAERERVAETNAKPEPQAEKPETPGRPEVWIQASPKRDMVILAMMDLGRPATRGEIHAQAADAWGDRISRSTVDNVFQNWVMIVPPERCMFTVDDSERPRKYWLTEAGMAAGEKAAVAMRLDEDRARSAK